MPETLPRSTSVSAALGATCTPEGVWFRVWAPNAASIQVVLETPRESTSPHPMQQTPEGYFEVLIPTARHGDLYRYLLDGNTGPFPDPASRFQPYGVHGPSQVIDPSLFPWTDQQWTGRPLRDLVIYELHTGTFTPEGTFAALAGKLPYLRDLGISAIELMPVADFPGNRNWGYDGVSLFAPARCYGTPDDLRRLIDAAHHENLAVLLDVVYNHFGPDGAYQGAFSPYYFTSAHKSPWGDGINLDTAHSGPVRQFILENALRWIHEYHFDGLRLDATHALVDTSPTHILAELASAVRQSATPRALLAAEDTGNLAHMIQPSDTGGWGLDAIWSDDFHHQMRSALAGDRDGYFQDFQGTANEIVETARKGWFFTGQHSPYFNAERGSDPTGLPYDRFVFFIQNHDQIGNRAYGDRLHHSIPLPAYKAATTLLLLLPETPLLFMGQEWAASSPFLYFTDHHEALGRLVTEGRRREFARFAAFSNPSARASIPDPQAPRTFADSHLRWDELTSEPHASVRRLYRMLLHLRHSHPALSEPGTSGDLDLIALDSNVIVLRRSAAGQSLLAIIRLHGSGGVTLDPSIYAPQQGTHREWRVLLTTDDSDDAAAAITADPARLTFEFANEGAIVLHTQSEER
jgi:maltooligosyltrehalose trehalohydrolase